MPDSEMARFGKATYGEPPASINSMTSSPKIAELCSVSYQLMKSAWTARMTWQPLYQAC